MTARRPAGRRSFRWPWRSAEEIAGQVDEEIGFHLDMRSRELEGQGLAPAAAREQAEREFGDVEEARRSLRQLDASWERHRRRREWFGDLRWDLRLARRALLRSPGFALAAVLTLALGIGGNTALFSVLEAVVLRPLPYPDADRLVVLWVDLLKRDVRNYPSSPADLVDYREAEAFSGVAGAVTFPTTLTGTSGAPGEGRPERLQAGWVTTNLFEVLGVAPRLGRGFEPADGAPFDPQASPGAEEPPAVVLLGNDLWRRRFGGDPEVVGRLIRLDGAAAQVVGVMPPGVQLLAAPGSRIAPRVDLWMAARLDLTFRRSFFLYTLGRLAPGATLSDAQGQMDALSARQREQFANYEAAGSQVRVERLAADLSATARPRLVALFGAVAFVLLIASVNVANLQLLRASERRRELSVRAALGAGRRRLTRELFAESALLALLGGLCGLGLAGLLLAALKAFAPPELPRLDGAAIDGSVLAFSLGLTLVTALLFGTLPALRAARPDLMRSLGGRTGAGGGAAEGRLRNGLVILEVGLALVLLAGAGLMVKSLVLLHRLDLGFEPAGVLTFEVSIPGGKYPKDEERALVKGQFEEALAALPGVAAVGATVGATSTLPLDGAGWVAPYGSAAALADGDESDLRQATVRQVRPGYFAALGGPLLKGRAFTPLDERQGIERTPGLFGGKARTAAGPPVPVGPAVVDEELATAAWPGEDPIGQPLYVKVRVPGLWFEVVGVPKHQRQGALVGDLPTIYLPDGLTRNLDTLSWAVRAPSDPLALAEPIRRAMAAIDPEIPVDRVRPLTEHVTEAMAPTRFSLWLIGLFAAVALALAAVGLYGVLASAVRQRTAEIGVRLAFGATRGQVLGGVLGRGLLLAVAGVALGLLAAVGLTRYLGSMLVATSPTDPATFAAIALLLLAVAAAACALPARRATRIEPVVLLRED
jgi:putative ABC transport system permease protein